MNKLFLSLLSLILSFTAIAADYEVVTKNYDVKDYTGICVSSATELTIVKSETCSLTIVVDERYIPYIKLSYTPTGVLTVAYDKLPFKLKNSKKGHMKITAGMRNLNGVDVTGASTLYCDEIMTPASEMTEVKVYCSGASNIKTLNINAVKMDVKVSGASKVSFTGKFGELDMEVSGASKAIAGGEAGELDIEVSGASSVNAESLSADDVDVDASGASGATVTVNKTLSVEASSASSVKYIANGDIQTKEISISGASALKCKNEK